MDGDASPGLVHNPDVGLRRVERLRERLRGLTEAVTTAYAPQLERLGCATWMRSTYLTVTSPEMWAKWIRPELLGLLADDGLSVSVRGSEQIVELDAGKMV